MGAGFGLRSEDTRVFHQRRKAELVVSDAQPRWADLGFGACADSLLIPPVFSER